MVSSNMICQIHERLQATTGIPSNVPFGGVSILAVGDLQQLPPVGGRAIYNIPNGNDGSLLLWTISLEVHPLLYHFLEWQFQETCQEVCQWLKKSALELKVLKGACYYSYRLVDL